jgi:SAM-dependent methyltransferase
MEKDEKYWREQSKTFDAAADYYDRFRPSYPAELIDCIINKTGINSNSKILEIGAGSGKATELFVNKGFNMLCVEPGENLVEAGIRKFSYTDKVKYCTCRFEDWKETPDNFDAAISAQAFHWVPKPIGFQKCFSALKKNGHIALFWNLYVTDNSPIDIELENTGMFLLQTKEACEERIKSHVEEIRASNCFKEAETFRFPWSQQYTAEEYLGFLKTSNYYLSASEEEKKAAEAKVTEIINRNGGSITRPYLCVLFLAQKL